MSYILDALRKSEQDRVQQTATRRGRRPGVVSPASEKSSFWGRLLVLIVLLNLLGVLYVLYGNGILQRWFPALSLAPQQTTGSTAPADAVPVMPVVPALPVPSENHVATPVVPVSAMPTPIQTVQPVEEVLKTPQTLGETQAETVSQMDELGAEEEVPVATSVVPDTDLQLNPEAASRDLDPVKAALGSLKHTAQATADESAAEEAQVNSLPLYNELPLSLRSALPDLEITIHVYAADASARKVYINGRPHAEGQRSDQGYVVEKIVYTGAILSYKGTRFFLPK